MTTLIKKTSGDIIRIEYENGIKIINEKGSNIVLNDAQDDYDCVITNNDTLYLVYQDLSGNIACFNGLTAGSNIVLENKSENKEKKNIKLIICAGYINMFYVLKNRGKLLLVHQILGGGDSVPKVIDYAYNINFDVACDNCNNIYVFYNKSDKEMLGYKRYKWAVKNWGEFDGIISCTSNNFEAVFAENTGLSLVYEYQNSLYNQILRETDFGKYIWEEKQEICAAYKPRYLCQIFSRKEFWVLWETEFGVFGSSRINSKTFSPPSRIYGSYSDKLKYIMIKSAYRFPYVCVFKADFANFQNGKAEIPIGKDYLAETASYDETEKGLIEKINRLEKKINYLENKLNNY